MYRPHTDSSLTGSIICHLGPHWSLSSKFSNTVYLDVLYSHWLTCLLLMLFGLSLFAFSLLVFLCFPDIGKGLRWHPSGHKSNVKEKVDWPVYSFKWYYIHPLAISIISLRLPHMLTRFKMTNYINHITWSPFLTPLLAHKNTEIYFQISPFFSIYVCNQLYSPSQWQA